MSNTNDITLKIDFGGGLELLFSNQRSHQVTIPSHVPVNSLASKLNNTEVVGVQEETKLKPTDVSFLIHYLRDHLLKDRPELFVENDTVRPGILVLINDTDWELEGEGDYVLKDGDVIVFISTLHGG